jgi:hypothetical protein
MGKIIKSIIPVVFSTVLGFIGGGPWGAALAFAGSALGFVLGALAPKPKKPKLDTGGPLADRQQVIRQSVAPRDVVYGTAVKSGTLAYAASTGTGNEFLHLVIALAGHKIGAFLDIWLNDEIVGALDVNGVVTTGRFANKARFKMHLGEADQVADPDLLAESSEWDADHRMRGCPYLYPRLQWDQTTYTNGIPNPKAKLVGRDDIYDPRDGISRWTNNWALVIRDFLTRPEIEGGWGRSADQLDDADFIAAANISDQMVEVVHQELTVTVDATLNEFTLSDVNAYIWACDGVQIVSDGTVPGGLDATRTYYWIETGQHKGKFAISLRQSRNRTPVDLSDAGTGTIKVVRVSQPRYTCDGVYSMDEQPLDILEAMVLSGGGWFARAQGKDRIFAGAEATAEHELDGSWLRDDGEIGAQTRPSRQDLFNAVRGTYVDPARFWKENTFPAVTSDTYQAEDGGVQIDREYTFDWQINGERAQRVSAILLNRHRLSDMLTLPCNWKALPVRLGNALTVTLPVFGYDHAIFRCIDFQFAENFVGIDLVLQRDDPSCYAWSPGQAQAYASAPAVTLYEPWNVPPATGLVVTDDPLVAIGGSSVPRLRAAWTAALDAFVVAYRLEYKLHTDPDWIEGDTVTSSPAWVSPVTIGLSYDVRVIAVRNNGAESTPDQVLNHTAGGDNTAPGAPTGLSATGQSGGIQLAWTNDGAGDLTTVEVWRATTNSSGAAVKIADVAATPGTSGAHFDTLGSGVTMYYWFKSKDGSGNVSTFSSGVSATSS